MSLLLKNLLNPDSKIRKAALAEASQQPASPEILAQVERLAANDPEPEIRAAALEALDAPNLRALRAQRLLRLKAEEQRFILQELDDWQTRGLIGDDQARALRSRYRVVFKPAQVKPAPVLSAAEGPVLSAAEGPVLTQTTPEPESPKTTESAPPHQASSPAPQPAVAPPQPPRPVQPRPSLAQLLLSETAIKTFLYLGAFFVIASAVILAALVEVLRLPILSLAVLAFGGTAIALKKRLPQPSFTLFIVFSFLLPINAGVFSDLVNLAGQALAAYWTFVLLVCAVIWVFATWFYQSRFFTLAALGSLVYSSGFVPGIFSPEPILESRMASVQFGNLLALGGLFMLTRKKDARFAQPAFLFSQFLNILLASSLAITALFNLFANQAGPLWAFIAAAWLFMAVYYAASHLLKPFALFPWFATLALSPALFFLQLSLEFTRQTWALGLGWTFWAFTLTVLSEMTYRLNHLNWLKNKTSGYPLPLSLAGIALFLFGGLWGAFESVSWAFALFLAATILLGLAHLLRPRGWVWLATLVYGLFSYFIFFNLPFLPDLGAYLASQITLAAILLTLPDILLRPDWRANWKWFLPIRGLAVLMGTVSLFAIPTIGLSNQVQAAVCAMLLSGAYWIYAIRYNKAQLAYLPGFLLALGLFYALEAINEHFEIHLTLAALTGLVFCYYVGGWALERFFKREAWSQTLRRTGLFLAPLLAFASLLSDYPLEGWLIGLLAIPFIAETRREPNLEIIAPLFLILGFGLILFEHKIQTLTYYLSGMTILWLSTDYLYKRILPERPLAPLTYFGAFALVLFSANALLTAQATPGLFATSLGLTLFLLAYALLYRKAQVGYIFTIFLSISAWIFAFTWLNGEWLWALTPLALALFVIGLAIQNDWGETMRFSGLGLAALTAFSAPFASQAGVGWFVTILTLAWLTETWLKKQPWAESGFYLNGILALWLFYDQHNWLTLPYFLAGTAIYLLAFDLVFGFRITRHPILALVTRALGGLTGLAAVLFSVPNGINLDEVQIAFALTVFFALYAPLRKKPVLGFVPAGLLAVSSLFLLAWMDRWEWWLAALTSLAVAYFIAGLALKNAWGTILRFSSLGLAALNALYAGFWPLEGAGWFVAVLTLIWLAETLLKKRPWAEGGFYLSGVLAFGLLLYQYDLLTPPYFLAGAAIYLLGFDLIFGFSMARTPLLALPARGLGGLAAAAAILTSESNGISAGEVLVAFALTIFFWVYMPMRRQPLLGYIPAGLLVVSVLFLAAWADWWEWWPWGLILLAVVYYLVSLGLGLFAAEWSRVLRISAIGLGTVTSFGALLTGPSVAASIPIAIAASLWAVESFRRRNVWLGFPTNVLYLMSYFSLLLSLEVTQPQFYSVGAALLGLLMHYLLARAGSDKSAFVTGLISQLVLLGTTYIQMIANEELGYFVALFFQALAVLVYGLVVRSRSLVGLPIVMLVLGVTTVMFFILRGLSTVILIGCTGIVMILVATLAVVLRERLAQVGERLSSWRA